MSPTSNKALRRMRQLESLRPRTADQLDRFLRVVMKLSVPRRPVVEGNQAPFDYLAAAFLGMGIPMVSGIPGIAEAGIPGALSRKRREAEI